MNISKTIHDVLWFLIQLNIIEFRILLEACIEYKNWLDWSDIVGSHTKFDGTKSIKHVYGIFYE